MTSPLEEKVVVLGGSVEGGKIQPEGPPFSDYWGSEEEWQAGEPMESEKGMVSQVLSLSLSFCVLG